MKQLGNNDKPKKQGQGDAPLTINLPLGHSADDLVQAIARLLHCQLDRIGSWQVARKSIDARRKGDIRLNYSIRLGAANTTLQGISALSDLQLPVGFKNKKKRPVVVGSGPAGLFAALALAKAGLCPLVLERGQPIAQRKTAVDQFWVAGELDPENNVQFGEGGAGTFSDGKLTTNIKDYRSRAVLEELVLAGAPESILIEQRPHVGTDLLCGVVTRIRETIESLGGEYRFGARVDDLLCRSDDLHDQTEDLLCRSDNLASRDDHDEICAVVVSQLQSDGSRSCETIPASAVILAIGHSSRDTMAMLHQRHLDLAPKPFSIGVRIEHPQRLIDRSQYGPQAGHPDLPPAEYKLAVHLPSGRSVYTFCMCPGGQVVASTSEIGGVVTNGMSLHARDQVNANSALLVEITPDDFPEPGPLGGIALQRDLERRAFDLAGQNYRAPAQLVGDFLLDRPSQGPGAVQPSYTPGVTWTDLNHCLPGFAVAALREALPLLDRKLNGFADPSAVMTGVETRSSSPVRILRDETLQSSLCGLYPCGEGAGYAGGIMSAAVDGLRCAQALIHQLATK